MQKMQQQQHLQRHLRPSSPTSTSPVPTDYCSVGSSRGYPVGNSESIALTQNLQQLHLQQQPLLQAYVPTSPLHSVSGTSPSGSSKLQGSTRPVGSIVQGTPIVSQAPTVSTSTPRGFYNLENPPNPVVMPRPQAGSIMQGTPLSVLPTVHNSGEMYMNPSSSTLVPITSFGGGGSIMQGTPVNRIGMMELDHDQDMEGSVTDDNSSTRIGDNDMTEKALDLSIKNAHNHAEDIRWRLHHSEAEQFRERIPIGNHANPQISVTDEEGEVTDMSWNVYAQVSSKNGTCRLLGLSPSVLSEAGDFSPDAFRSELQKSSSGSIEVQLSSDCSHLTVAEIFALIERSIHTNASGLVSCQMEDAAALLLERPGEDIHVAVEVSTPAGPEGLKGLKIRRISGDFVRYDRICNELIACISM